MAKGIVKGKYRVKLKVACTPICSLKKVGRSYLCGCVEIWYTVTNLKKFANEMSFKFPNWRWMNVFQYDKNAAWNTGEKLGSYSCHNPPTTAKINL